MSGPNCIKIRKGLLTCRFKDVVTFFFCFVLASRVIPIGANIGNSLGGIAGDNTGDESRVQRGEDDSGSGSGSDISGDFITTEEPIRNRTRTPAPTEIPKNRTRTPAMDESTKTLSPSTTTSTLSQARITSTATMDASSTFTSNSLTISSSSISSQTHTSTSETTTTHTTTSDTSVSQSTFTSSLSTVTIATTTNKYPKPTTTRSRWSAISRDEQNGRALGILFAVLILFCGLVVYLNFRAKHYTSKDNMEGVKDMLIDNDEPHETQF
eukprot:m.98074 g.98074  ORF g.98074 m.98074 type:complete len:268 (+) comp13624_c0_seq1:249-1052(+)